MGWAAAGFLLAVVLLTLTVRLGARWMGRRAGRTVHQRFRQAECICNTGRAPREWLDQAAPLAGAERRGLLLRRLDGLAEFFRRAPVVADEPTRRLLLERLGEVRRAWAEMPEGPE